MTNTGIFHVTEAGRQIERALEQGYEIAAFNLYLDAIRNDVPLTLGEGDHVWHREMQRAVGWHTAPRAREGEPHEPEDIVVRDAAGRVVAVIEKGVTPN